MTTRDRQYAPIHAFFLALEPWGMEHLHSLALDVQLQTTSVTWLRAISVGMLYFILAGER